jgi:SAM-dependent methyltransferase
MKAYEVLKQTYRAALPASVRTWLWQSKVTRGPRAWLWRQAERLANHDELYNDSYYRNAVDPIAAASAPAMTRTLFEALHPTTVVDVGCGTGQLLLHFQKLGVTSTRGLEYSEAALAICRDRGLQVQKFDLEQEQNIDWRADLVTSTEVAEHLPERCADRYVDLLCSIADRVFMTAATPGQTGTDHVNEQPNEYWIAKLAARGFVFDSETSHQWRAAWPAQGVADFYYQSAMLFRRG